MWKCSVGLYMDNRGVNLPVHAYRNIWHCRRYGFQQKAIERLSCLILMLLRKHLSCGEDHSLYFGGWLGGAKVLCILHHWGVQLILAYSWARPAILVVGKGRGGMFLFLLFLHFHSCSSFFPVPLFHLLYSLFLSLFSLSLGDDTKWPSRVDVSLNPNTIKSLYVDLAKIT